MCVCVCVCKLAHFKYTLMCFPLSKFHSCTKARLISITNLAGWIDWQRWHRNGSPITMYRDETMPVSSHQFQSIITSNNFSKSLRITIAMSIRNGICFVPAAPNCMRMCNVDSSGTKASRKKRRAVARECGQEVYSASVRVFWCEYNVW